MSIRVESTSWKEDRVEHEHCVLESRADSQDIEKECLTIFPDIEYQRFKGFGCAVTESVGHVLESLEPEVARHILEDCFSSSSLHYQWVRCPIDSCDFSLAPYSSCTLEGGMARLDEAQFESHDLRYIIPWVKKATQIAHKRLDLYLTPWSPPAWMKTNGERNHGGRLLPSYRDAWAKYIASYVKEYEKHGLPVAIVGVQNEPNASQRWDSCLFSSEEEHDFILDVLHPALRQAHLEILPLITIWDHNKERLFERVREVYREDVREMVGAASFHWYSGDHFEQIALTTERYPELLLIFSEGCIEYSHFSNDAQIAHAKQYAHQIIGDLNHGAHIWLDWNMVLDTEGGPNHMGNNCDAPILCNLAEGTYQRRLSYYYIRHFSRWILPGAVRIAHSLYTDELEATAWKNPDRSIVVVVHNPTDEGKQIHLREGGRITSFTVGKESIITLVKGAR